MNPLERIALLCELATSRDPGARRVARVLVARFPDLPSAQWVSQHLDAQNASARAPSRARAPVVSSWRKTGK